MHIKRKLYQMLTPMVVQRGDAYREDLARSRPKPSAVVDESFTTQTTAEKNTVLREAQFWESWSGSRFIREDNPIINMTRREYLRSEWSTEDDRSKPNIVVGRIARSNPVTGNWEIL